MPRKQLFCVGCSAPLTNKQTQYCTRSCEQRVRALKLAQAARQRENIPRKCSNQDCDNLVTGRTCIKYCSRSCRTHVCYLKTVDRIALRSKIYVERKTEENLKTARPCTICGKTTARSGGYNRVPQSASVTPTNIFLCIGHTKGYGQFVKRNGYEGYDLDDVFAAYLIRLAMGYGHSSPHLSMMRKAFHAQH